MAKVKDGSVEFKGLTYVLTRKDFEMVASALQIISPDTDAGVLRAGRLASIFEVLAEAK